LVIADKIFIKLPDQTKFSRLQAYLPYLEEILLLSFHATKLTLIPWQEPVSKCEVPSLGCGGGGDDR
jgi:hypothetical protein